MHSLADCNFYLLYKETDRLQGEHAQVTSHIHIFVPLLLQICKLWTN